MKICLDRKNSAHITRDYPIKKQCPVYQNRVKADSVCFSASITYTKKEQAAYDLAKKLFNGKYRKDEITPYFEHCEQVGKKLKIAQYDEDTVAAGFLHDVVEDIENWTLPMIKNIFGTKTAALVEEVSHKNPQENWDKKVKHYISHLKTISPEGMAIAACDKMASLQDDIQALKAEGSKHFKKLSATPAKQLLKHLAIYQIIIRKHPPKAPLANEYTQSIKDYISLTTKIIFSTQKKHVNKI